MKFPSSIPKFSISGKPHPRWAEPNFCEGDPSEKWHSRASKSGPSVKRPGHSPDGPDDHVIDDDRNGLVSMRYHVFQADVRSSPGSSYENEQHYSSGPPSSGGGSSISFHPSPPAAAIQYNTSVRNSAHSPFQNSTTGGGGYAFDRYDDDTYVEPYTSDISPRHSFCPCRTSLSTNHVYVALGQQLQNTVSSLRQYHQHPPHSSCLLYRRIIELTALLQYVFSPRNCAFLKVFTSTSLSTNAGDPIDSGATGTAYDDDLSTPTDSDIMTPSSHTSYHPASSSGPSSHEWQAMAVGHNSFFHVPPSAPPPTGEHGHHSIYST